MKPTYRPNLKFSELPTCQAGMASPSAIDALATALTLVAVALVVGVVVLLEHLSEFWAGIVLGGILGMTGLIGLLGVGACLGGSRLSEPPRPGSCDRGGH